MESLPKVGVITCVIKEGKVLFGKRKNSPGAGTWCLPGGHLEFGESWEEGARREIFEETGLGVENIRLWTVTNEVFPEEREHYVMVWMVADCGSGEPRLKEPEKFERWDWFFWNESPQPLMKPIADLMQRGGNPFDAKAIGEPDN
ncbi:MAG: NUDIX domain-containing protein [Candidatus Moranbacteria bacterium]|nr:NUDIX domain-containing protein [Candidatus Moranbacteria bacterium]